MHKIPENGPTGSRVTSFKQRETVHKFKPTEESLEVWCEDGTRASAVAGPTGWEWESGAVVPYPPDPSPLAAEEDPTCADCGHCKSDHLSLGCYGANENCECSLWAPTPEVEGDEQ